MAPMKVQSKTILGGKKGGKDKRRIKVLSALFLVSCVFLFSCLAVRQQQFYAKIKYDSSSATYPKHRIDDMIRKICIIGIGEGKDAISSKLTELFTNSPSNIEVIAPGNLESILGGRIEYSTGLTRYQLQALSQRLQIDHILLFNAKISPHQDYQYGGRWIAQIGLKIINARSGKLIFETIKSWGSDHPDPRRYGFSQVDAIPGDQMESVCFGLLRFELHYALGNTDLGVFFKTENDAVVQRVHIDSPADRAGIQEGDKILQIDGFRVHSYYDLTNYHRNMRQGDSAEIKIERGREILKVEVKYPVIPFAPVEERHKAEQNSIKSIKQETYLKGSRYT
jgi:hypothetical protein